MKIKSLKIKNFKAIDKLEINFTSNKNGAEVGLEFDILKLSKDKKTVIPYINYIIGRNSIGKTSTLDAIALFAKCFSSEYENQAKRILIRELMNTYMSLEEGPIEWSKSRKKIQKEIKEGKHSKKIEEIRNRVYVKEYEEFSRNQEKEIKINITFDYEQEFTISLTYPSLKKNVDVKSYRPIVSFDNDNLKPDINAKIMDWANNTLHLWSDNLELDLESNIEYYPGYYLGEKFYNRKLIQYLTKNEENPKNINNLMKLANPRFIEFVQKKSILVGYAEKGATINQDVNRLSSGTKKFLKLLYKITIFSKLRSGILLIDEIENNMHKELINVIKIGLSEITKKYDLQVIVTTHNPLILNEFTLNKQIITLDDEDGKIVASKVSSKMKPKNSVVKKYENNEISMFPNPEYAEKISREVFSKW